MRDKNVTDLIKSIAFLPFCFLFCACAEHNGFKDNGLIRLGVKPNVTRTSVNDLDGLSAVGGEVGVYGVITDRDDAASVILSDEWGVTPLMNNVCTSAIDAVTGALSWEGAYAYPLEDNKYVKFCVYHPYAPLNTQGNNYVEALDGASPVLHFTLTGAEDVMWAQPVTGSRTLTPTPLIFNHLLTQLRFCLIDDEGNFTGTHITGFSFNEVNTASTLDIEAGELGAWSTSSDNVSFPLPEPIAVTGTSESPQLLSGEVMLQPGQSMFSLTVNTDNRGDFPNVEIRPTGGETVFAAGHSYLVSLKFREHTPVSLTALVTPWVMAGTGEGTVE